MRRLTCLLLALAISGCATSTILKEYEKISFSDGISKEEAIIIAKKEFISSPERKYYSFKNMQVTESTAYNAWAVKFWEKSHVFIGVKFLFGSFTVLVNKDTGAVKIYKTRTSR